MNKVKVNGKKLGKDFVMYKLHIIVIFIKLNIIFFISGTRNVQVFWTTPGSFYLCFLYFSFFVFDFDVYDRNRFCFIFSLYFLGRIAGCFGNPPAQWNKNTWGFLVGSTLWFFLHLLLRLLVNIKRRFCTGQA